MTVDKYKAYFKKRFQNRTSSFLSGWTIMIFDLIGLFLCIGLSFFIVNLVNTSILNFRSFILYSVYFPLILIVFYGAGLYPGIMISPPDEVRKITICTAFCFIGICISIGLKNKIDILDFASSIKLDSTNVGIVASFTLAIPVTALGLCIMRDIGRHILGGFNWWGVPAVIYVTGESGNEVIRRLYSRRYVGYIPCLIVDSNAKVPSVTQSGIPIFPPSSTTSTMIKELRLKVGIICDYKGDIKSISRYYRYAIFVTSNEELSTTTKVRDLGGILGFSVTHNLTRKTNLLVKRAVDLLVIILTLPIVLPIMAIIAIGVKASSPGSVFYKHKRVGKNGKTLYCLKFRSMYKDSDKMLKKILATDEKRRQEWERDQKFIDDPRITPFGKILRKTSMDELPQLFNILKGEMSFVGPRPVTKEELDKYGENASFILSVTPGLSGMWQISGRSDTGYEERVNLDSFYIQNWSIWLDVWIIIKTIWVVLKGKGAY